MRDVLFQRRILLLSVSSSIVLAGTDVDVGAGAGTAEVAFGGVSGLRSALKSGNWEAEDRSTAGAFLDGSTFPAVATGIRIGGVGAGLQTRNDGTVASDPEMPLRNLLPKAEKVG